ncbi:MAG: N-acetyl-gamma-glutamyl-phosphate reductase [Firmicutes bacterium]|nr:N-acetyl-gamma-glutamyl-phosphate reductase [Bacillota bacterium]
MTVVKVGIVGASGYTGGELVRILARHPGVELVCVSSRTYAGRSIGDVFPSLFGRVDLVCRDLDPGEVAVRCDVVFTAVPHGAAMSIAAAVRAAGTRMIDLGADHRFRSAGVYEQWYGLKHEHPELLDESVYGISELNREKIRQAWLVGNPGCYPTTVLLGLAPLVKSGLADISGIVIDSKSGVSGAGRKPGPVYHYPECNDNMRAYGVAGHRHTPEIEQGLSDLAGQEVTVTFTPHLIPLTRGMLSTMYVHVTRNTTTDELTHLYEDFYKGEHFVRVLPSDRLPETKAVAGSNFCDISVRVDVRTGRAIVVSAIDNLVKGASGQAVQNMNIMLGMDEDLGLDQLPIYP